MQKPVYVLLGSNLGHRHSHLCYATVLMQQAGILVLKKSRVYETAAWGKTDQPKFYNQVLAVHTTLGPQQLLAQLQSIEQQMGRKRIVKWGQRIIDLDILYYGHLVLSSTDLTIPHAGIPDRRFTLAPLAEVAPAFVHPKLQLNQQKLLGACPDPLAVTPVF